MSKKSIRLKEKKLAEYEELEKLTTPQNHFAL